MELNVHSQIDAITNSSTETYSMNTEAAVDFTYELLSNVAKVLGIKDDIKTLFKVEYQEIIKLDVCDIQELLEYEYEDLWDKMELEFKKFRENNKDLNLPKEFYELNNDNDEIFNTILTKVGLSREAIEQRQADKFFDEGEGYPPDTKIIITPLNDKAKVINLDFTEIVRSGEVWNG